MSELVITTDKGELEIEETFDNHRIWITIESQYAGSIQINKEQAKQIVDHLKTQFEL